MNDVASCIAVYQASWLSCWQFSVTTPNGMTFGTARTEEEAWDKARTLLSLQSAEGPFRA